MLGVWSTTVTTRPNASLRPGRVRSSRPLVVAHRGASAVAPENTLAALHEALRPTGVRALVELKAPDANTVPAVAEQLRRARMVPARVTVQSFDAGAVRMLRQVLPGVGVGVLLRRVTRSRLRELAGWADLVNVHHARLHRGVVEEAKVHALGCYAWTVNHPAAARRLVALGVDGIVTDRPDQLRSVCPGAGPTARTGAWWP